MSDRSGQILGNYRLVRLLGQGGFSDVYLGEHMHLNTYAAIKVLRTRLAEDGIDPFRNEARTLAHLRHPNIVQVLDFGVEGMTPYLIMQFAPNGTLRQRHPRGVPVALNVVVSYVQQMASALQYAHNQKLIHRDIKPENMLVSAQNQLLLSDFGIAVVTASARAVDPLLASASLDLAGTASYMAPEQIQGKTVPASDQYALAIVAYEWLSGVAPFSGSYMEVVSQQISATPPPLRGKIPGVPPDVEHVILNALNKDPQRRFGHIEAFAIALTQAAALSPVAVVNDPRKSSEASAMEAALSGSLGRTVLGSTRVTLGRAPDNTIVLDDVKASSRHAEIRPDGPYYYLVDLGSTNGTFVNEQQVSNGMPRRLLPGDAIRIGDTRFAFEVSGAQPSVSSDGSTLRAAPPPPAGASNTAYGMANINYGQPPDYQETLPAQSPSFTPPRPPYPAQPSAYAPPQPPYSSETQTPTYTPSSYGQGIGQPQPYAQVGQQPAFTPQPIQPVYAPPQQQKRSPVRTIVLAVVALLIVLAAAGGFFVFHNNQVAQSNLNATATSKANVSATANAQANVSATANAQASATANASATAIVTSHYPPFMTVAMDDALASSSPGWNSSSSCQFTSATYQVSIAQANTFQYCLNSGTFSDMAYQVSMNIQQGDCGGLIFRHVDSNNYFAFEVCKNGTYNLRSFVAGQEKDLFSTFHANSAIQQGLNKQNTLAVTVQSNTVNMYVNGQNIDVATDTLLVSSKFSQGEVGLMADDTPDPTVVAYSRALIWTKSA